jgi:hypothetical protein
MGEMGLEDLAFNILTAVLLTGFLALFLMMRL